MGWIVFNALVFNARINQISDHKPDIYLYEKLYTKLLAQAANKNAKFIFTKTGKILKKCSHSLKKYLSRNSSQDSKKLF